MGYRRPVVSNLAWAVVFALSAGVCVGSVIAAREVIAEGYLSDGLYRSAARIFIESGWPAVLVVIGATMLGLAALSGLTWVCRRQIARLDPTAGGTIEAGPAAIVKVLAVVSRAVALFDRTRFLGPATRITGVGLAVVLYSAWGGIFAFAKLAGRRADRAPNVLLVVMDTVRADHVGVYGRESSPTPNLDAFAKDSFLFRHAYSASSWTRPSLASILTSTLPTDHKITTEDVSQMLPRNLTTLPEFLRELGYRTGAFLTNPHYKYGMEKGFDTIEYYGNMRAKKIYDRARTFLDGDHDEPFFLLVHNNDPHDAYEYRKGFSRHPKDSPYRTLIGLVPSHEDNTGIRMDTEEYFQGIRRLPPVALAEMRDNYDDEITYMDHYFGAFLDELEGRGLLDNTIVVVVADHGEEFLDHGSYWHGSTLYNELIRVPMLIKVPGMDRRDITARVSTVDLVPTLLDLIDAERGPRAKLRGRSLVPLLRGESLPSRPILGVTAFRGALKYSIINNGMKLIQYADGDVIGLYNLDADPNEKRDRSQENPERVRELSAMLTEIVGDAFSSSPVRERGHRRHPGLDDDTKRELRELGYLVE